VTSSHLFEGYVALPLHPTLLSQQESGHPIPRRERAKRKGPRGKLGLSLTLINLHTIQWVPTPDISLSLLASFGLLDSLVLNSSLTLPPPLVPPNLLAPLSPLIPPSSPASLRASQLCLGPWAQPWLLAPSGPPWLVIHANLSASLVPPSPLVSSSPVALHCHPIHRHP